jgi:outer membrane receptor protein involved in Fe transport
MSSALVGNESDSDASSTVYKPETNWNCEIGTHLSLLADKSLAVSAALFYIDCRNQQLTVFPKGMSTGRMMSNAGKSFSYGAELGVSYRVKELLLTASYGYTHAEFREYRSGDSDYSGKILPLAPRETVSANLEYGLPVSGRFADRMALNVGWNGVGRIYWNEENSLSQAFYGVLNASVVWEKDAFGVSLWGKNLLDEQYNTFYFRSIGNDFFAQGKPLHFGVSFHVNL